MDAAQVGGASNNSSSDFVSIVQPESQSLADSEDHPGTETVQVWPISIHDASHGEQEADGDAIECWRTHRTRRWYAGAMTARVSSCSRYNLTDSIPSGRLV